MAAFPLKPEYRVDASEALQLGMLLSDARLWVCVAPACAAILALQTILSRGPCAATWTVVRIGLALGVLSAFGWLVLCLTQEVGVALLICGVPLACLALLDMERGDGSTTPGRVLRFLASPLSPERPARGRKAAGIHPRGVWVAIGGMVLASVLMVTSGVQATAVLALVPILCAIAVYGGGPLALGVACAAGLAEGRDFELLARAADPEQAPACESRGRRAARSGVLAAVIGAATTGWSVAVHSAIEHYEALPPPPEGDCYVATAASRGHARLVGARNLPVRGGVRRVTEQLLTLKAGELALKAAAPRLHRALRRVYDRVGPPIARRITTPWRADLAHLTLVPLSCLVQLALALVQTAPPGVTRTRAPTGPSG